MRAAGYPFSAIVGQEQMKLALLLAAVDWRVSVLLRGDKGAGKTTIARGLAALLPGGTPFINLPIGATEDRLLGGLNLERALHGDPSLKPGVVAEAHGGVLYVDEVNLLPAHLGDSLLDVAASGLNVVEREGFSVTHTAEFVLLGSMNPEEGSLRPQLIDRFALAVDVAASLDPDERQQVITRRIAFDREPVAFLGTWSSEEERLRRQIARARARLSEVQCPEAILALISRTICKHRVLSLRADLAAVRAAMAYAALAGSATVDEQHVEAVLPLVLAHRQQDRGRSPISQPKSNDHATVAKPPSESLPQNSERDGESEPGEVQDRVFSVAQADSAAIRAELREGTGQGKSSVAEIARPGPVIGTRSSHTPKELDVRASIRHAVRATGEPRLRADDLHERVRKPSSGTRYLLLIDSSGSHAAHDRMRRVKGVASSLLTRSFRSGDDIVLISVRGSEARVILEPNRNLDEALAALEYLPTGGRTPLAHGLELASGFVSGATVLIVLTDGRANVSMNGSGGADPWEESLQLADKVSTPTLVIDTEDSNEPTGRPRILAEHLNARYVRLEDAEAIGNMVIALRGDMASTLR